MPKIETQVHINCAPDAAFALLADFANYHRWLGTSETFQAVQDINPNPIQAGTTYTDRGTQITMHGTVLTYEVPQQLTFQQSASITLLIPLGTLGITVAYALIPTDTGTQITRTQTANFGGVLSLLQGRLMKIMKQENIRILDTLKAHLEQA